MELTQIIPNFAEYITEHCSGAFERCYMNGCEYILADMKDGWIAVFERDSGEFVPKIQAKDKVHALSWCNLREKINIPVNHL